jgi:hypothetical protein
MPGSKDGTFAGRAVWPRIAEIECVSAVAAGRPFDRLRMI